MKCKDIDLLCAALAFTAVAMTSDSLTKDGAQRAAGLAYLIKEFCRASVPEAFVDIQAENRGLAQPLVSTDPGSEKKFDAADRMGAAIAQLMRENDGCLPQDLLAKGFTPDEITRYWPMAKALAQVELNRMDA